MEDQKTPVTEAKTESEAKTEEPKVPVEVETESVPNLEEPNPNLVGSDTPTYELPEEKKPDPKANQAAFNAKEVAMEAEEEGVTAADMLAASIEKLRIEHVAMGGGMNTPLSKAITFVATAIDLIKAM